MSTSEKQFLHMDAELEAVARRCVWWARPEEALASKTQFLCHVMVYGLWHDALVVRRRFSKEDFIEALDHAPAGLFDVCSWHYWHHVIRRPVPPLPRRSIPGSSGVNPSSKSDFHLSSR